MWRIKKEAKKEKKKKKSGEGNGTESHAKAVTFFHAVLDTFCIPAYIPSVLEMAF